MKFLKYKSTKATTSCDVYIPERFRNNSQTTDNYLRLLKMYIELCKHSVSISKIATELKHTHLGINLKLKVTNCMSKILECKRKYVYSSWTTKQNTDNLHAEMTVDISSLFVLYEEIHNLLKEARQTLKNK